MKWSDNDLDKMFQEMDSKASLDFQESYWTEMQQILNAKEKKKGFVWWLNSWFLIPVSLVLIGTTVVALGLRNSNRKTTITAINKANLSTENQATNSNQLVSFTESEPEQNSNKNQEADMMLNQNVFTDKKTIPYTNHNANSNHHNVVKNTSLYTTEEKANNAISTSNTRITENNSTSSTSENSTKTTTTITTTTTTTDIATNNINENPLQLSEKADSKVDSTSVVSEDKPENILTKTTTQKSAWRMYVGAGVGMLSNLGLGKNHQGAGVIRFEYGVSKTVGRFIFAPAIAIENSFGSSITIENNYYSYEFVRKDNKQEYSYNRFTNVLLPIRLGVVLGKNQRHLLQVSATPIYTLYNNLIYKEFSNATLVYKDEYYNQNLGINRFYMTVGMGYNYQITNNVAIGFEYMNNLGLNRKDSYSLNYTGKVNHQFMIQLKYYIK
jgi:hypothetical protein